MKYTLLLLIMIFSIGFQGLSQHTEKRKLFLAIIIFTDGQKLKGELFKVDSTSLEIKPKSKRMSEGKTAEPITLYKIEVSQIRQLTIRPRHAIGSGIIIGGLVGTVAGAIMGYNDYVEPDPLCFYCVENYSSAVGYTIGGAFAGLVIGGTAGAIVSLATNKTYIINGDQHVFNEIQKSLKKRQIYKE